MDSLQTIFILLFAAVLLIGVAQKVRISYPIILVLAGTIIGFIPGLQAINFDPDVILLVVLPPVLYYAAFGIAFREFQQNWKNIFSLAVGLVVFTTIVIAVFFKWLFPQFSWALAFTFGAIISPPDAIAATTILKRFAMSSRLISILEGESLINDASAIMLYKFAVSALLAGSFSLLEGSVEFIQVSVGGVVLGLISGFLFQLFSKRYLEPTLGVVFSFSIPYITFITANFIGVSGVLAVVVNGLIGSRILITHHSSLRRVLGYAAWDIFIILLNCFVFIIIGLQLKTITSMMTINQIILYGGYAFLIAFAMVAIRMIWVYANAGIFYIRNRALHKSSQIWRETAIIGWSGMRGIVSLAIVISLPYTLPNGVPLEGRNEVVLITFLVILITLLIPGLSLPTLIRRLKIQPLSKKYDERRIRKQLEKNIEEKLDQLLQSEKISLDGFTFLKAYFFSQHRVLELHHETGGKLQNFEVARLQVIQSQRKKLLELWENEEIDDKILNHLENELDVMEIHIARAELF